MKKVGYFRLECSALDEELKVEYDSDDEWMVIMSHIVPSFYALQNPVRKYFERMFKMMFCAISGKEYRSFEIIIDKDHFQEFKKWVTEL